MPNLLTFDALLVVELFASTYISGGLSPYPPLSLLLPPFCRCGEGVDRTLLSSLLHMSVDLQVSVNFYVHTPFVCMVCMYVHCTVCYASVLSCQSITIV